MENNMGEFERIIEMSLIATMVLLAMLIGILIGKWLMHVWECKKLTQLEKTLIELIKKTQNVEKDNEKLDKKIEIEEDILEKTKRDL